MKKRLKTRLSQFGARLFFGYILCIQLITTNVFAITPTLTIPTPSAAKLKIITSRIYLPLARGITLQKTTTTSHSIAPQASPAPSVGDSSKVITSDSKTAAEGTGNVSKTSTLLLSDYLSSTRLVKEEKLPKNIELSNYLPYGEINDNKIYKDYNKLFTSHRLLPEANIYHTGARFYSPTYGLFLTPDPVEGPNRYTYVQGNPTSLNDPTGNCVQCDNFFFKQYVTGENPWRAKSLAENPTLALAGKLDAWTGILSSVAFFDRQNNWLDSTIADSKQYVSKSEAEIGFMSQMATIAANSVSVLANIDHWSMELANALSKNKISVNEITKITAQNSKEILLASERVTGSIPSRGHKVTLFKGVSTIEGDFLEGAGYYDKATGIYEKGGLIGRKDGIDPLYEGLKHALAGDTATSPYMSWTPDYEYAKYYAGPNGQVVAYDFDLADLIEPVNIPDMKSGKFASKMFSDMYGPLETNPNWRRIAVRADEYLYSGKIPTAKLKKVQ